VEQRHAKTNAWTKYGPVRHAAEGAMIQPSLFVDDAGAVRLLARTRMRHIAMAQGDAQGMRCATARATSLKSPNSGMDAVKVSPHAGRSGAGDVRTRHAGPP
jgi:hypothetical protein